MPSKTSSNKPKPEPTELSASWKFEAIGTEWWIGIYQPVEDTLLADISAVIGARIQVFDKTYSRFKSDSLVSQIARKAGSYVFPEDSIELFAFYRRLYDATDGLVTPLIGQVLADAGYDAEYSMRPKAITTPPDWDAVMHFAGTTLTVQQPVLLDFGAAGKGYLVDIVSDILRQHGIARFCVDAGGDIVCRGLEQRPLRIGMEHPDDLTQAVGVVRVANGALCGSAGNRRKWAQFHHIIDPKKHISPQDIQAVWVSAETALEADGLTTALYFVPAQTLDSLFIFEYAMMYKNGELQRSPAFLAEIFTR